MGGGKIRAGFIIEEGTPAFYALMEIMMNIEQKAQNIRKSIIEAGHACGVKGGHFGGSLSMADLMAVLFGKVIHLNPENVTQMVRDRFILSKGHCAQALYATLYEYGFITHEQLLSFNANGSDFPSHCVKKTEFGIDLSSGSLGLGLSFALGQALGYKQSNIYVMAGNGELNEGSFWEAAMFAGHKNICSVCLIVDDNQMQLDGLSQDIMPVDDWAQKLKAFHWEVVEIDGHNFEDIETALSRERNKPLAIIAHTVKGKGVSFMEGNPEWHHHVLNDEQYALAMSELE